MTNQSWKTTLCGSLAAICEATAATLPAANLWAKFALHLASALFVGLLGYFASDHK